MSINWDSSSMSTLLSSLPSSGKGFFGTSVSTSSNLLSDYYSIKNGSYSKLMKAYYNQQTESSTSTSKTDDKDDTTTTAAKSATKIKSAADSLSSASDALLDTKLYKKVETTDSEGKTSTGYDVDAIMSKVSDFVNAYNDMIKNGADSDNSSVASNVSSMKNYTKVNSKMLAKIGISIGSDNKLSLDEVTFKKADMSDVQSMFGARGGYGYQMSALASSASYSATYSANTGYTSSGSYSLYDASSYTDYI